MSFLFQKEIKMLVMNGILLLLCTQHYLCDHILNSKEMNITTHMNNGLFSGTCYVNILRISYFDCFNEFKSNEYDLNVMVYVRRYLMCDLCMVTKTLDLKETPGSILVSKPITDTSDENIAVGKPASNNKPYYDQTLGFANASLAVDGNWESSMSFNSAFACTQIGTNGSDSATPWWMVNLQKVFPISRLEIQLRSDCCGDRFKNILVEVGETVDNMRLCAEYPGPGGLGVKVDIVCQQPRLGQFVRISKPGAGAFEMCEVAVYR